MQRGEFQWSNCIHSDCLTDFPETVVNKIINKVSRVKQMYPKKYEKLTAIYQRSSLEGKRLVVGRTLRHFFNIKAMIATLGKRKVSVFLNVFLSSNDAIDFFGCSKVQREIIWQLALNLYETVSRNEKIVNEDGEINNC